MLNLKVIGAGAAGNKAAIELCKSGFKREDITLINSTSKDIPEEYKSNSIIFGATADTLGGCGKERDVGRNLFVKDLKSGAINLDTIVDGDTRAVIIVSSTEGGSGSAVTPIIGNYIKQVCGVPVILVLFFGFNSDVRGMQNSIELCQELTDRYGVIGISNSKYLEEANNNKIKAEQLANKEFCKIVRTLSGVDIHPGSQNIDDTDLYKLVVTPGYMCVGRTSIKGIKNIDAFNKALNTAIDESKLIDSTKKTAKRIGLILDMPDSMDDCVDYNAAVLAQRYGTPYELFTHVQHVNLSGEATWIIAGMDLPIDEIKEIFENYKKASSSVAKEKDNFFETVANFAGNDQDSMFNMLSGRNSVASKSAKNAFFSSYNLGDK